MPRRSIIILLVTVFLFVAGGAYYLIKQRGLPASTETGAGINWDNPDEVFNVKAPDDFDAAHLARLEEKITNARDLYKDKKDDTWTWIVIGNMYEFAHDYERAIEAYKKSAALNSNEHISRLNLAYIYENQKKDYSTAEKYYNEVIALSPGNPVNYVDLARMYELKAGRVDDAEKIYLFGLEATGNNPDVIVALVRFYLRQKMENKAAEQVKNLFALYPDNASYKNDFGYLIK